MNANFIISRTVLYAFMTTLAVAGYVLFVGGINLILGEATSANNPVILGLMTFFLVLLLNPIKTRLQKRVDRVFFRGDQLYQEMISDFNQKLNPNMGSSAIASLLRRYIDECLSPTQLHIFALDSLLDQYIAFPDETGQPSTDIQFAVNSTLPQLLSKKHSYIYLGDDQDLKQDLQTEKARINILGTCLFVPMSGRRETVIGFLALAPRRSGESYTNSDIKLLASLCDQASLAIERSQVVADLERSVNDMNVLIRVVQGINITLRFDDILELIYAHAVRIIPTRDFWILLRDHWNDFFYYAFYVEDDQRLLQYENHPLTGESDLAQEVICSGQMIITADYDLEARVRGYVPQVERLFSWLGVPLNAGAETIGALSLGSRDPNVVYTSDQVELLQAIADQAAGAIVKARLLEESERSAQQLKMLNEVARNLSSTLDLSSLLDQILENAIDIIDCEAGNLYLIDEDTDELIVEAIKGPVNEVLQGKRLQQGTGLASQTVMSGEPSIFNETRLPLDRSKRSDQLGEHQSQDLLLAPMFVKENVIGVIEVINRRDGLPFTQEDQDLLMTFTSQAAIALENARLYTMTDQQLAERVDELSVMQRIDRELNTSLDINKAMRITLDWALRWSGADAGLVGVVDNECIHVMADHGYADELDEYRKNSLPIDLLGIKSVVEDERIQQIQRSELTIRNIDRFRLLTGAQSQIIIPIRREEKVIGIVMLENTRDDTWTPEVLEFLSRLSDHAAIAIANAQLFGQVQDADLAKSEFVSLVSHELKTPMTSIRGYTDLLLGGAVGEVNEAQVNFLNTIRSNVNRMATLVSDLTDVSRIESGRLRLEFSAVALHDVIEEVVRSQQHSLEEKEQKLAIQTPESLPPVWGDRTRLVQVLTNLLSNANKYTPLGGKLIIKVSQAENQWDQEGAPEVLLVAVQDDGIGISDEEKNLVFTKFFRSADSRARENPGTGLGLNITRYLVEMQGGKTWFESGYGEGSTFFFTVPIMEV